MRRRPLRSKGSAMLDIIARGADAPAILAPDRAPLTFGELRKLASETVARLNALGIGRNDRVAIVLPNGPEMAAAFVAIGARRHDRAAQPGLPGGRIRVLPDRPERQGAGARRRRQRGGRGGGRRSSASRSCDLETDADAPAGAFRLAGEAIGSDRWRTGSAEPDDIALVLHTSGTTSRPKIVPLTRSEYRRFGKKHPRDAAAHADATAASTSCRSFTSTG